MIDKEGYRANVGIIITNDLGKLFWARRIGMNAWQFPQGGIKKEETVESAMFRELNEEVGLIPEQIQVIGCTEGWLRYKLPKRYIRYKHKPVCIGQKQVWYLLRLNSPETEFRFDRSDTPEFDQWKWVDYWYPVSNVVPFKRRVYKKALKQLHPMLNQTITPDQSL